jgi:hypothetical protein
MEGRRGGREDGKEIQLRGRAGGNREVKEMKRRMGEHELFDFSYGLTIPRKKHW